MPGGTASDGFKRAFEGLVLPALRRFSPELILLSAGFVLLLVGLVGLLSRTRDPDAPPATTDSPTTTTIASSTTLVESQSTTTTVALTTMPPSGVPSIETIAAKVAEDHEPFGPATVEYSSETSGVLPFGTVSQ